MFNINKNYAELAYRQTQGPYIPKFLIRQQKFLNSCAKLCPKCGAILPISAKGCDSCLFQFDKRSNNNAKRVGKGDIKS